MTPKERVKMALNHQEPDHVPLGEIEIDGPIVEAVLGRPTFYRAGIRTMKAYLDGRRDEVVESMKHDYVEFIRKTELDVASFAMEIVPDACAEFYPLHQIGEKDYSDENGNIFRHSEETNELIFARKGSGPVKLMAPRQQDKPFSYSESELEFVKHVISELGETHFIVAPGGFSMPGILYRSADNSIIESLVSAIAEDRTDEYRESRIAGAQSLGKAASYWKSLGADAVWGGQDIGHNQGTFVSPEMCREMLLPVWKAWVDNWHESGMSCIWHACGNNRVIWDQFVEAGIDAYQAIQEEEPLDELKRLYGGQLTIMGGVSCRTLDTGTPDQIREETRRAIETTAEGGGFILSSSHSLHAGVKYENFTAMLETWHKYR
jgi:uroporphyrinogen decarboxylase